MRLIWAALVLLALSPCGRPAESKGTATEVAWQRRHVVVNDPANPKGMQIRRARADSEPWPAYFCEVYLWPYSQEHYNHIFTSMSQNGHRVQFIGNTVFASGDSWYLVLRGTKEEVALMARNIVLESGGPNGLKIQPQGVTLLPDPAGNAWVGLVTFAKPAQPVLRIMSSFALFGKGGGVHEVLDEEAARHRYAVIRDILEFIEKIYREELGSRGH
jgi:hypothetical protein